MIDQIDIQRTLDTAKLACGMTAMWPTLPARIVKEDFDPAHHSTECAPERVSMMNHRLKIIESLSPGTGSNLVASRVLCKREDSGTSTHLMHNAPTSKATSFVQDTVFLLGLDLLRDDCILCRTGAHPRIVCNIRG